MLPGLPTIPCWLGLLLCPDSYQLLSRAKNHMTRIDSLKIHQPVGAEPYSPIARSYLIPEQNQSLVWRRKVSGCWSPALMPSRQHETGREADELCEIQGPHGRTTFCEKKRHQYRTSQALAFSSPHPQGRGPSRGTQFCYFLYNVRCGVPA